MKYVAVCFDADGMIIDSSEMFSIRLCRECDINEDAVRAFFKGPFQKLKIGEGNLKEELAKVVEDWGWKGTVDELVKFWFEGDVLNDEVKALIQTLRSEGTLCHLTSNQEQARANYLRSEMGFDALFDAFFISSELKLPKPSDTYFDAVWKRAQQDGAAEKAQVLFCDDEQEIVDAAKAYGFDGYHYTGDLEAFTSYLNA